MESGFDGDTEQDNSAWYLSPDSSPKHPKTKTLGPTVVPPPQTRINYKTGSQLRTSSFGDDYDHLPMDKSKMASVSSPLGVGHQSVLVSHGYHKPSQSFDACDILSTKPHPQHKAASGASTAPHQSSSIPLYTQPSKKRTAPSQQPQQKSTQWSGHTRSVSQPEELHHIVAQQGRIADGNPERNRRGAAVTHQPPDLAYGCRLEREQGSRHPQRPEHVVSDEALQRVHPHAHMGGSSPGKPSRGHSGERTRHKSLPPEKLHTHQQENYYVSDESQTSGGTPSLPQKAAGWVNSHDSGFDSMNREKHPLSMIAASRSGRDTPVAHIGTEVEVDLEKAPTLGLGITGGIDGENAIKPGDPVSGCTCYLTCHAISELIT